MDAAESWGVSPAPPSCGPRDESASLLSPAGAEVVGQHLQGEADEGLHEVRDGLPRGARPRRESHHQDNLRRLQPLAGRVGGDGALPVAEGSLPGGEVRGAVLLRREAMDCLPAAPRDAGLRGDDRLRRLVGPRRQPGGARGGDSASLPRGDEALDEGLERGSESMEEKNLDHLPAPLQNEHRPRAALLVHRGLDGLPGVLPPKGHRLVSQGVRLVQPRRGEEIRRGEQRSTLSAVEKRGTETPLTESR